MAKFAVALIALLMLGAWAWFSYDEFKTWHEQSLTGVPAGAVVLPSPTTFAMYVAGLHPQQTSEDYAHNPSAASAGRVRIALGAIVALAATLFYSVSIPSGSIFSINLVCFTVFFTGAANMVFPLVLLARTAWAANAVQDYTYHLGEYALLMYAVVTLIAAFTVLRNLGGMRSGKATAMSAVWKCLTIVLIAGAALAPLDVLPEFALLGFHGLYWLAALCLLSLLLIALTRENYRYD